MSRRHGRGAVLRYRTCQLSAPLIALGVMFCVALSACADTAQRRAVGEQPTAIQNAKPPAAASGARKMRLDAPVRQEPAGPPTLKRADLDRVLAAGPGALLQHVPLKPAFSGGQRRRFQGFLIARIFDNSPEVLRFGPRPGDRLRSVNGLVVNTPDQLMAVFKQLQNATVVQVSVVRDGQRLDFSWPVVDRNVAPEQESVAPR